MRVLLLSPTLGLGGAERLAVLYAEGLKQRGHEVLMAFGRRSRWDAHAFSPTVETRLLTEVQLTPKTMLPWVRALRLLIQDFKPDVLFTQSITVAAVAGIAAPRIPHVVMLHGIPDDQERLAAFVLRSSRAHAVAVSDQTANGITRHRGAPPVETLRSGIDIAALERNAEVPIDPPLPEGSPRFIYIGRFVHQKATEILIAAFAQVVAQHPGAQLVCAGIGPELDERKQQAADLGIAERIVFLGAVGNVAPYIRASDAFVLSSRWEGLPVVLLETLALGTPAIATAVDGSPLVVRDGETGWLAPPEDVDAFAARMLEAAADPAECKRRGENGRALIARDYDAERVLDRIDAMLRESVAPLPLPPRPYHAAVRRLERARTRRAATNGLPRPDGIRILAYHRVFDAPGDPLAVTPGEFAEQMEALAASDHEVVSLARALELLRAGPVEGRYACHHLRRRLPRQRRQRPARAGAAGPDGDDLRRHRHPGRHRDLPLVPRPAAGPDVGRRRGAPARRRVRHPAAQPHALLAAGARPGDGAGRDRRLDARPRHAPTDALDRSSPTRPAASAPASSAWWRRPAWTPRWAPAPASTRATRTGCWRCAARSSARTRRPPSSRPSWTARWTRTPGCTARCAPAARGGEGGSGRRVGSRRGRSARSRRRRRGAAGAPRGRRRT